MRRVIRPALVAMLIGAAATAATFAADVERVERGNLILEGIPEIPEQVSARLARYQNARSANLEG